MAGQPLVVLMRGASSTLRQPFVDLGDADGGEVAYGELVVSAGHDTMAFELADPCF